MRVSLNWLKDFIDLDVAVDDLCEKMTMLGLEIESVERPGEGIQRVVVGEIKAIEPHPDADKLVVCSTDVGEEAPLQIVCGATNMKVGDKVPTACVGSTLPGGFKVGKRTMRGVASQGMMCSERELGMGDDHEGLLILEGDVTIGEDVRSALGLDDVVLEIEVTPNRNDWSSMIGVARELAAAYGVSFRIPEIVLHEGDTKVSSLSSVTIDAPDLCPRYIGRVLTGVKIGPSPAWLAQRLVACGLRPINNVVDVTNYVLMETGQPLHAFDFDRLKERRIVVRQARAGEGIKTIEQETHTLDPEMLVIADASTAVAVAGVMGGLDSEVGEGTTSVFIESAYFNPVSIRRTARALNMITESSQRFQRGADPDMALIAANRACQLIQELTGADLAAGVLDEYPKPLENKEIELRYSRTDLLLGTEVAPEKQRAILDSLGFEVIKTHEDRFKVRAPLWRPDVSCEADLIEEVARFHGYDNIAVNLPYVRPCQEVFAPEYGTLRELRNYLVERGVTEIMNWTFSSAEEVRKARLGETYESMVVIANPLSERQATMRSTLIPGLLNTASSNLRKNHKSFMGFELGPVYGPAPEEELPEQGMRLAVLLSGFSSEKHWSREQHAVDLYDLIGHAEGVVEFLGNFPAFEEADLPCFSPGHCALVKVKSKTIGALGEVSDSVLKAFEIDRPVYLFELDLAPLLQVEKVPAQFTEVAGYPSSLRDLAVVVDGSIAAGEILKTAQSAGGKHLKEVKVFDIYTGAQVAAGKKSVALSLLFQSNERTLTDRDTQKSVDRIVRKLESAFSSELR